MNRVLTFVAALGLCLWTGSDLHAQGIDTSPGVTGEWLGFYRAVGTSPGIKLVRVAITEQERRRFSGKLLVGDSLFDIEGTISASGNVHIIGCGQDGLMIGKHDFHDMGEGAAILAGGFKLHFTNGDRERGAVILLRGHRRPAGPPPAGKWAGTLVSNANEATLGLTATFSNKTMPNLGLGAITDPETEQTLPLALVGSISGKGTAILIGLGPQAVLVLRGQLLPPDQEFAQPHICGSYALGVIEENVIEENVIEENVFTHFGTFCVIEEN